MPKTILLVASTLVHILLSCAIYLGCFYIYTKFLFRIMKVKIKNVLFKVIFFDFLRKTFIFAPLLTILTPSD